MAWHHDGQADQTLGGTDDGMPRGILYQRLTARLSGLLVPKGSTMASYNLLVSARHTSKSLSLLIKLVP